MKVPVIRKMVETLSVEQLKAAEEALMDEKPVRAEIEGADEGEKLTHTLAAIYIKEKMQKENIDFNAAVRSYSQRVRNSIS